MSLHEPLPTTIERFITENFHPGLPAYRRVALDFLDSKTYWLLFKQGIFTLSSIGAAYIYAALSNDYFNNPNASQRPWFPEDELQFYRDLFFSCSMIVNPCIAKLCVDLIANNLNRRRRYNGQDISANHMLTQYQQSFRVVFLTRLGQGSRVILTLAAFLLSLSNLRAFSFTFNNFLRVLSCAINIPITWYSVKMFNSLPIFERMLYGTNTRLAHSHKIARALQDIIEEQRIACENKGYPACLMLHQVVTLCTATKNNPAFFNLYCSLLLENPEVSSEIQDKVRLLETHFRNNDQTNFLLEKIRLLFAALTSMGTVETVEDLAAKPLLDKGEQNGNPPRSRLVDGLGAMLTLLLKMYYIGVICILSGLGYPADGAMGIKQVFEENNWSLGSFFQFAFWCTFFINFFSSSGLAYGSGVATFAMLMDGIKDLGVALCYKLPKACGLRPSYLFGNQWHTVVSLEYHLSKSERFCNFPLVWFLVTLTLIAAAACSWAANAYVNEVSIVPFAQYIGLNNVFSNSTLTGIKDHLTATSVPGAFIVNYYFSSLFAIGAAITLLYFGRMDKTNETKREVRQTFFQIGKANEVIGNLSPAYVDILVAEDLNLLPEPVMKKLPSQSVFFFHETRSMAQIEQPPHLVGEQQNAPQSTTS